MNASDQSPSICLLPMAHVIALVPVNIMSVIIGTIGNALVIATVCTSRSLQTISNFWLASMAVADLLVTALGQPLLTVFIGLQTPETRRECNEIVYQAFRLIANVSCSASILHLCLISIDRCLVILRPLDSRTFRTKTQFKICLAFVWTLSAIYAVLRLTVSKRATSYFTVIVAGVCYVIIICCYASIIIKVRKQAMRMRGQRVTGPSEHVVERRVTFTIAIVVVIFTVCWFPLMFLRSVYAENNFGVAYNWARTLGLSNSSMNPWIYCYRIVEFRDAYKKLLKCQRKLIGRGSSDQHELNAT